METGLPEVVTAIEGGLSSFAGVVPDLAIAGIGVGILLFAARKGWTFVKRMV